MRVFISFWLVCAFLAVQGKLAESERAKQEIAAYHDQFLNHVETSLSNLNDTLHKWRQHEGTSRAHTYLSQATKHSVDALSRLEDIVTSHELSAASKRRNLRQIYDDTSKQEADKRLQEAKKRAEDKFQNALVLLQEAAQKAAQNTSAELLNQLNSRIEDRNIVSSGKILSQELETMKMASKLFDLTKGLFPGVENDATPSPSPPAKAATPKSPAPAKSSVVPKEVPLVENMTSFDFYKEKAAVFDRFDDTIPTPPQGPEGPVMRRRLSQHDSKSKYEMLDSVEESLKAIRSLGKQRLSLSKESIDKIKMAAQQSREGYAKLIQDGKTKIHGRRLSQDMIVDSESSDSEDFLTFPGEPFADSLSRIAKGEDEIVDQGPMIMETTTFVFIPVSNTTDAEELINQILGVIMASMAEAVVPLDLGMFDEYPLDVNSSPESEHTASWTPYYEKPTALQRRRKLHSTMGQDISNHGLQFDDSDELTFYVYDPIWFKDAQDKNIISSIEIEENSDVFDGGDDSFQISMAIRMSSPEELGGLSDEMIRFLGAEDISSIESMYQPILDSEWDFATIVDQVMMPRFSLFNYPQHMLDGIMAAPENHRSNIKQAVNNEGLADVIVQKLQNSLYRPSEPSHQAQSDPFDIRWFGVMFGFVGIVMIFVMGSITAFRRGSSGYTIIEDGEAMAKVPSSAVITSKKEQQPSTNRKVSNLPA